MSTFQAQAVAEVVMTDVDATQVPSQCHIAVCHPIPFFYELLPIFCERYKSR
jgi:hypothetical protein